ncbi:MAG: glutaredoxin domain-containing protein [Bdellovibrionota bacterium]
MEIKVYTTDFCPYCVQAKRLLDQLGLGYEEINLNNNQQLRMQLSAENGGWRTVPMIFIGDEFVGGFNELASLHKKGQLLPKLNAGAQGQE